MERAVFQRRWLVFAAAAAAAAAATTATATTAAAVVVVAATAATTTAAEDLFSPRLRSQFQVPRRFVSPLIRVSE